MSIQTFRSTKNRWLTAIHVNPTVTTITKQHVFLKKNLMQIIDQKIQSSTECIHTVSQHWLLQPSTRKQTALDRGQANCISLILIFKPVSYGHNLLTCKK